VVTATTEKLKRLAELRKDAGLTQEELAHRLGMSRSSLANYETGQREPDFEATKAIAQFFEVSVDYLLGQSDLPKPEVFNPEWRKIIAVAQGKGYSPDQVLKALELLEVVTKRLKAESENKEREV